jgi:hypothetical protein
MKVRKLPELPNVTLVTDVFPAGALTALDEPAAETAGSRPG